ncbi:hypothetical protein [Metapseudomonas otitidis]|uniref:hypothetical protein n=1 Tax=Metapseudomonas otitidis TaxID=319939 RepID=UPI001F0E5848|nr:hypothetical protein [Pseudomonas otitidis]
MMKINTLNEFFGLSRYELWKSGWDNKSQVDEYSYISDQCNPEDVLLSCRVVFPDFVVVENGVFLERNYSGDAFLSWLERFGGDLHAVERMINHTHLYDLFDGCVEDVDDRVFEQLAEVLAFSWKLILENKFPDRRFDVKISNSEQEYGPVVTFCQVSF